MARAVFSDDKGRQVTLGQELGRGGEATVYAIDGDQSLVAKIYHRRLDAEKTQKLSRMVELQSERLLRLAAWPVGTLRPRSANSVAGVLMRNVSRFKDIHLLYNTKSRLREFPAKANWRFLVHTAANVSRAFSVIHEHRHVIADVNQRNVKVSPESAIVSLIDCDSFQIFSHGRYFLCGVGVPEYTPPELQDKQFNSVIRTPNHDNFGLAVLVFHLLFMGRHPFAGKFLGRGDMPIEKAIEEYRFAFAPDAQRTLMQPPPNCITLAHLSPEVRRLFVDAFAPGGANSGRPDATQWVGALDALGRQLKQCSASKVHTFFQSLSVCPWCQIEGQAGVLLFVGYAVADGGSGFRLELVWAQIASVQSPGPGTQPDFSQLAAGVRATLEARVAGGKRRRKIAAVVLIVFVILGACLVSGLGAATFWIGVFCVAVAKSITRRFGHRKAKFESESRATEARFRAIQERWQREASEEPFATKLRDLRQLIDEHKRLPSRRQEKIRELERDLYNVQLRHYLEKFDIASADIPHVKDSRKAMLSSYGIDDAADVTATAVEAVPGFGQFLTDKMLTWRRSLESKFKFDARRGIDPSDIQRVDQDIAKRRMEIELRLLKGQMELTDIRRRIVVVRAQLRDPLQKAWMEMAQAQANARAA
jgi:DNA-binding helix-hairpin-helix protein with protein kinase domain